MADTKTPLEKAVGLRTMLSENEKELVAALGPPPPNIEELDISIPTPDGHSLPTRVWRQTGVATQDRPLIIMFHGGGFAAGSYIQGTIPARTFAQDFNAVVVSPTYRLAPEHKFPTGVNDSIEATRWLAERASSPEIACNPTKGFVVGGLSAGGNFASVVAHHFRKNGGDTNLKYPITGSFLGIPQTLTPRIVPEKYKSIWTSSVDNLDNNPMFKGFYENVLAKMLEPDESSVLFSPANDMAGLSGLPRTFIQVGDLDVLRDDGVVYAKILEEAGVEVKLYNCKGQDHQAYSIWWNEGKGSPSELKDETMKGIAWLLRKQ